MSFFCGEQRKCRQQIKGKKGNMMEEMDGEMKGGEDWAIGRNHQFRRKRKRRRRRKKDDDDDDDEEEIYRKERERLAG
jgi:hypothetical protein